MTGLYRAAFAQPTAHAVAAYLLRHVLDLTSSETIDPCLFAHQTVPGDPQSDAIKASRQSIDRALKRRFRQAQRAGDLPSTANPAALAALLILTLQGLARQATERVPRAALEAQAETLLQLFASKHLP